MRLLFCIAQEKQEKPDKPSKGAAAAAAAVPSAATPMEEDGPAAASIEIQSALRLVGHESEVFVCCWSPREDVLASGCVA